MLLRLVFQAKQLTCRRAFLPSNVTGDVGFVLGYALLRSDPMHAKQPSAKACMLAAAASLTCCIVTCSDGTPTATLRQRVEAGVDLYARGRLRSLIFSGGHPGSLLSGLSATPLWPCPFVHPEQPGTAAFFLARLAVPRVLLRQA